MVDLCYVSVMTEARFRCKAHAIGVKVLQLKVELQIVAAFLFSSFRHHSTLSDVLD